MNKLRATFFFFILGIIALFLYSFTQVDLSLTLSRASIFQLVEKQLQYLGFYQRPVSAIIFISISTILFICYLFLLYFAKKGILKIKQISVLIIITLILLTFSYNAFSYDLFNYIFDAKIVTAYSQNPYFHKAADFAGDPMLSFMRWTHRVYPYGPSWLALTVPLSFLGFGLFLPTFFLFKFLMGLSFLGSAYLIYKISDMLFPKDKIFNLVFWAFNPLVLIECLVSAHNDVPMIFFMLLSIYLYLKRKTVLSIFSYIFSVGVKYSSGVLLPVLSIVYFLEKTKRKINWENIFLAFLGLSLLTTIFATIRTNFQPWYLIFPLAMASFVCKKYYVLISSFLLSFFSILIYFTYVLMTDYAKGYPGIIFNIQILGLTLAIIAPLVYKFIFKRHLKVSFD